MADSVRGYPDIDFVETDTATVANDMVKSFELYAGRTLYPGDPVRLLILWFADIIVRERVNIDFSAKQNIPRYSEGEYLDSLAELFNEIERLEPERAKTTLRFTLSAARPTATAVAEGTRVTTDGQIIFETVESLTIPAGDLSGEVAAACQVAGEIGNGLLPGQINQLIDVFPYFGAVTNTTESEGGADEETDAAFYQRFRESWKRLSTAGSLGAYEYYAKSASALIADVKATSPTPGVADVRVLLQNGELPGDEIIQAVTEKLTPDDVRPFTDFVQVGAPDVVSYDIDFTYYTQAGGASGADAIAAAVDEAVDTFKRWQSEKMGRDINPSELHFLVKQAGAKRVEIRKPEFQVVEETAVAIHDNVTIVDGGVEDE